MKPNSYDKEKKQAQFKYIRWLEFGHVQCEHCWDYFHVDKMFWCLACFNATCNKCQNKHMKGHIDWMQRNGYPIDKIKKRSYRYEDQK